MNRTQKRVVLATPPGEIFAKYASSIKDGYSILKNAQAGVPSSLFFELASLSDLNNDRLAGEVFGVSLKTIQRQVNEGKMMPPRQAETALKLLVLYQKGAEVFGEKAAFNRWLVKPAFGLGYQIPLEMLILATGIDLVMDELYRIEFGDLA